MPILSNRLNTAGDREAQHDGWLLFTLEALPTLNKLDLYL